MHILAGYWWVVAPPLLLYIFFTVWVPFAGACYGSKMKFVLLEFKIPKDLYRNPKAMEQALAGIHGIDKSRTLVEKYILGMLQNSASLEIVGINGGEIHFFIRFPKDYRYLVEANIYSQYPDVELFEVEDYVWNIPGNIYDNPDWAMWGTDYLLVKDSAYPIRTYVDFGLDKDIKEEMKVDPLANILEILGTLRKGENIWIQTIIEPVWDWGKSGKRIIEELSGVGAKKAKPSFLSGLFGGIKEFLDMARGKEISPPKEEKPTFKFLNPMEEKAVEAISRNISKLGFGITHRWIYAAPKEVFRKERIYSLLGAYANFNSDILNSLRFDGRTSTKVDYFFIKLRKRFRSKMLLFRYRGRLRRTNFIMSVESIATLFHPPTKAVATPAIKRTEFRKGGGPTELPA